VRSWSAEGQIVELVSCRTESEELVG
jgi:hypothetical protein